MIGDFWSACRLEEKLVILLCGAILVFCAGSEWARRQNPLPPLFHPAPHVAAR
jgi:hypothetical protein